MKNVNSTHRIEGVRSQFGLSGALAAAKVKLGMNKVQGAAGNLGEQVKSALGGSES